MRAHKILGATHELRWCKVMVLFRNHEPNSLHACSEAQLICKAY